MIIINKGARRFTIKVGEGSKELFPLKEVEVEDKEGELLISSFPREIFLKEVEKVEEIVSEVKQEEIPEVAEEVKSKGKKKK